jgi:transcriptional regulator with XRE-family HTH domain
MKGEEFMDEVLGLQQKAMIGHKLVNFMNANPKFSTTDLAHFLGITQSMVSKIRHDKASIHFDDLASLFQSSEGLMGSDEFKIAILNIFTSGFIPPLPNYRNVSTDLTALSDRVMAEMQQSMGALNKALDDFQDPSSANDLKNICDPEQAFKQLYDVVRYALPLMAIITNRYQLSWTDEANEREKEIDQHYEHQI